MNPYLERQQKLKEEAMQNVAGAGPIARAAENPYPFAPNATQPTVTGPELGRGLAQDVEPVETPMEPQEDKPVWSKLLSLLPAAGMAVASLGGKGTAETRGQMNRYLEQATQQNEADTQRAIASRSKATAYNNDILARKQERQRQRAQDTIAAEDRTRRIGKEDSETALAAQERDPSTPKNQALRQSIAQTYPEVWAKLTPEQQANFTTGDVEALTLSIKDENRKQALSDEMEAERSKQKAERDFAIPGGGVGGSDYMSRLTGEDQPQPGPGMPPAPAPPTSPQGLDPNNRLVRDMADVYGGIDKIPPGMVAMVRSTLAAAEAGASNKEMVKLHQDLVKEADRRQQDTLTRERQERQDATAQAKADRQQDAQYAGQRTMRNIDEVRSKLVQLKNAVAPYLDENGNLKPKADIPGAGVTGNLWDPLQLALTKDGRQIMKLKKELLDTRVREATGANAPPSEVKEFKTMGGVGTWDTDADMIAGMHNAEAILDQQEAYLDANFVDAAIRFHDRVKEQEAKKAAEKEAKKKGPRTVPNTPENRKLLGLE